MQVQVCALEPGGQPAAAGKAAGGRRCGMRGALRCLKICKTGRCEANTCNGPPAMPQQPASLAQRIWDHECETAYRSPPNNRPTHRVMLPTALPQRLTGEVQPVRGGCVRHPSRANLSSCGRWGGIMTHEWLAKFEAKSTHKQVQSVPLLPSQRRRTWLVCRPGPSQAWPSQYCRVSVPARQTRCGVCNTVPEQRSASISQTSILAVRALPCSRRSVQQHVGLVCRVAAAVGPPPSSQRAAQPAHH